ncbi:MAG: acyl-CoA dehydratase activase-related protein [Anaeromicrobium sp.]|jgi:predicted nucleotide-binding protein (sugar kinase/HSP70/actin superfamily)|uniref:acyl-CoA dehydratase activase-related protein n=1 Tax=Anaeromicrobium sp. TaxID=1929132 RepID=UPI0025EFB094|nr:acyl-CoA dehydratase activase-related protein [Anaeromicrobium sp.]MCT4594138.1 acyl-CoA dehydratase activase-related protein [Anaeromicrobium sp.]
MKIGIPRGLGYYMYHPLWKGFFESLGTHVVFSDPTNKEILDKGTLHCVDEACLPLKVYLGHILNLKNKVDMLFLPKLTSVNKGEYICPKFCSVPELVKSSINELPPTIYTNVDFHKNRSNLLKTVYEIGSPITSNKKVLKNAFNDGLNALKDYRHKFSLDMLPLRESLSSTDFVKNEFPKKILVLGHSYVLYDHYLSMNLINKIHSFGFQVITQDNMDFKHIKGLDFDRDKKIFWTLARHTLGSALCALNMDEVQGIVYLSSFGCGIDSVIAEIVERKIRRNTKKGFMLINLDEHTGEAGLNTRIEAFIDMIKWRQDYETNFSSHG